MGDGSTGIILQNHTAKAAMYFSAGPQCHTTSPVRSAEERMKLMTLQPMNGKKKNREWLIPTVLKHLWRKTVPKQTRSLDAHKCCQRQKAWFCHISVLSLIRWSRTRKKYLVYKSQPEQATAGTQPYWYSLEKTRQKLLTRYLLLCLLWVNLQRSSGAEMKQYNFTELVIYLFYLPPAF